MGKLKPIQLEKLRTIIQLPGSTQAKNSSLEPPTRYMPSMTPSGSLPQPIQDRKFPLVYIYILACVVFSPDGSRALSGGYDNTARLWDVETGREIKAFKGHRSAVFSVAFSSDGRRVITGGFDETARVWDKESGNELLELTDHTQAVSSVLFSPDGKKAITGSFDETIRIWDLTK